jgi:hypothetical protein
LKKNKVKIDVFLLLSILLLLASVALIFNMAGTFDYPFALQRLQDKYYDIDTKQRDYNQAVKTINEKQKQLDVLKAQADLLDQKKADLSNYINTVNWKLDIPSLLIKLEDAALEQGVNLTIYYDLIRDLHSGGGRPDEEHMDPEGEPVAEGNTPETPAPTETLESVGDSSSSPRDAVVSIVAELRPPSISGGVRVTGVPIMLDGNYESVKGYLSVFENMDYIEPAYVSMLSNGEHVNAIIILYVFSK